MDKLKALPDVLRALQSSLIRLFIILQEIVNKLPIYLFVVKILLMFVTDLPI